MFTHITQSPYGTVKLAEKVAQRVREGTVICLQGVLGAGKTGRTRRSYKSYF